MRLDRTVTLCLGASLGRLSSSGPARLPILMYHSISAEAEEGMPSYYKVCTSLARFREQMHWLVANGWTGMSLTDALARFDENPAGSRRLVAITFDDGFRNFLEAAPVLLACGFSATVYLPTALVGQEADAGNGRGYLTWRDAAGLSRCGIEFGAHTVHHANLHQCSDEDLRRELSDSKRDIEDRLGIEVRSFACPHGFPSHDREFSRVFANLLRLFGYDSGVTTTIGRATPTSNRYLLPRLPVNEDDDVRLLSAKLTGAYDWLATPQRLTKVLRQLVTRPAPRRSRWSLSSS